MHYQLLTHVNDLVDIIAKDAPDFLNVDEEMKLQILCYRLSKEIADALSDHMNADVRLAQDLSQMFQSLQEIEFTCVLVKIDATSDARALLTEVLGKTSPTTNIVALCHETEATILKKRQLTDLGIRIVNMPVSIPQLARQLCSLARASSI